MIRALRWIALIFVGCLLILAISVTALINTESGTRWIVARAASLSDGALGVGRVDGKLVGPLTLNDVTFRNDATSVEADQVELQWSPAALLRRRVSIQSMRIDSVRIDKLPETEPAPPTAPLSIPSTLESPVDVTVDEFVLRNVRYLSAPDAKPIAVDRVGFRLTANDRRVEIRDVAVGADQASLSGRLAVDNQDNGTLDGEFRWQFEKEGLTRIRATTTIGGRLPKPTVAQKLHAPYTSHVVATVDLSQSKPGIVAKIQSEQIELKNIGTDLPPISVSVIAKLAGTANNLKTEANSKLVLEDDTVVNVEAFVTTDNGLVKVESLSVASPRFPAQLRGSGTLSTASPGDVDVSIEMTDFSWPPTDVGTPTIEIPATTLEVTGDLSRLKVDAQSAVMAEPEIKIQVEGFVDSPTTDPSVDLAATWLDAHWPLTGAAVVASEHGRLTVKGKLDDATIAGNARVGGDGELVVSVKYLNNKVNADLNWSRLSWPLTIESDAAPAVSSPVGKLSVDGKLDDYRLDLDAKITALDDKEADISIEGNGDLSSIDVTQLKLDAEIGRVEAAGTVAFVSPWQVAIRAQGYDLNPGAFAKAWPGTLRLTLDATASQTDAGPLPKLIDSFDAAISSLRVDGTLRDYPITVSAGGSLESGRIDIETARLVSGQSIVEIGGSVDDALDISWHFDSPSLAELLPEATGRLQSHGALKGTLDAPVVTTTLEGHDIKYMNLAVAAIAADANYSGAENSASQLSLTAKDGAVAGVDVTALNVDVDGTMQKQTGVLAAKTSYGDLDSTLSGGFDASTGESKPWRWTGSVDTLRYAYPDVAPLRLIDPVGITASAQTVALERGCLESGDAQICVQANKNQTTLNAELSLAALPFDTFSALLPQGMTLVGSASGDAKISRDADGALRVDSVVDTTAGSVALAGQAESSGEPTTFRFEPSRVEAKLDDTRLVANGELRLTNDNGLTFVVNVEDPLADTAAAEITGDINGRIRDLAVFAPFVEQVSGLKGSVNADVKLGGTVSKPELLGDVTLADGGVDVTDIGVVVTNLSASLTGDPTGDIEVKANARVGDGDATLAGTMRLVDKGVNGEIRLQGKDLLVYQTADASIWVDPEIDIALEDRLIRLKGSVHVPRADISPVKLPDSAVSASNDQVFVDSTDAKPVGPPVNVTADVDLVMGDNVQVDAFGLTGRLDGALTIKEIQGEPTSAQGELRVLDGRYDAYGQVLKVERGRVVFAGGHITQPGIDVRALRRPAEDITVGVSAQGTLAKPKFSLFSEPAMTQRDQLSYLLLGESSEQLGHGERSAISQAEMALGLKGAEFLADKVGKQFGIDTFAIETEAGTDANTAALMIGKYLSPKLYVSYGLGLFGADSTLRAQYTLNKHWKISTESSEKGAGGDFIYSIESGE